MTKKQLNISSEKWLKGKEFRKVMNALGADDDFARVVGGAVRDALLNIFWDKKRNIGDIDIASKLTPEENMERLTIAGIKVVPTGVKHGTVMAVIGKKCFEITTLRKDLETDGRHAEVEFTDDWVEDAKRRDFTINALYLDMHGNVYDPLGGLPDLKAARVRFIGEAKERIKEDGLRILRLFRFSSELSLSGIDEDGLLASIELKAMIPNLSGERIWQELSKIITSKRAMQVVPVLNAIGLLHEILPFAVAQDAFLKYAKLEKKFSLKDPVGRLSLLLPGDEKSIIEASSHLRLSNRERDSLLAFSKEYPKHNLTNMTLRRVIYQYGKEVVIHNLLKSGDLDAKTLYYINDYQIPKMPYSGKDLIAEGWEAGRGMGAELKRREQVWIDADFGHIR